MINYSKNFEKNILLVGNGFDLAQGFKTSYADFVKYICLISYLSRIKKDIFNNPEYKKFIFNNLKDNSLFDNRNLVLYLESYFDKKNLNSYSLKLLSSKLENDYFSKEFINKVISSYYKDQSNIDSDFENNINHYDYSFLSHLFTLILCSRLSYYALQHHSSTDYMYGIDCYKEYIESGGSDNLAQQKQQNGIKLFSKLENSTNLIKCDENNLLFKANHDLKFFLEAINHKLDNSTIKNWLDIESFIKLHVVGGNDLKEQFGLSDIKSLIDLSDYAQPKLLQAEIELFAKEFIDYLRLSLPENYLGYDRKSSSIKKKQNNHNDNVFKKFNSYLKDHYSGFIDSIDSIDSNNITDIINYNYTSTQEVHFPSKNIKFYYVNGKIEKQLTNSKVLHNKENNSTTSALKDDPHTSVVFGISDLDNKLVDERLYIFEKKYLRQNKNIAFLPIKELTSNSFNLVIYGHSCGLADADVLKPLLTSNNLKVAMILCYNEPSRKAISSNIIKIIGKQKFYQMLENASNQKSQALCFSIHDDNI